MSIFKKIGLASLLLCLVYAGATGCGSDNNNNSFTITPSTATVKRGGTQQFDTNPTGLLSVTWSVVGGSANGTIDSDGLYTAPSTLPVDNVVTIQADDLDFTDTATVTLVAADTLSFDAPEKVNDTPAVGGLGLIGVLFVEGASDGIGAGLGSVDVSVGWLGSTGTGTDVFYSQATDLAPFLPEVNLTNNTTSAFNSLILDQDLNPGIFFNDAGSTALTFLGSSNQGASFSAPVPVVDPPSGLTETAASGAVDDNNLYHLTYSEDFSGTPHVKYTQSSDQGASWTSPINVTPSANSNALSTIAVSSDGETLAICYTEDLAGDPDIFASVSTNGGTTFTTQTNVSNTAGVAELFCRVGLGPNGEIYVAYQGEDGGGDGEVFFSRSTNGGSTFSSPVPVNSSPTGDQGFPYMGVDDQGRIDITYQDGSGADPFIAFTRSLDAGLTFSSATTLVPSTLDTTILPRGLVHDESGRMHFLYVSAPNSGSTADYFYINGQ